MTNHLRSLLAAADRLVLSGDAVLAQRRRFLIEFDRRGLFLRLGRVEAYCCTEPERGWWFRRETDGFDAQAWRLHLIVGRVP